MTTILIRDVIEDFELKLPWDELLQHGRLLKGETWSRSFMMTMNLILSSIMIVKLSKATPFHSSAYFLCQGAIFLLPDAHILCLDTRWRCSFLGISAWEQTPNGYETHHFHFFFLVKWCFHQSWCILIDSFLYLSLSPLIIIKRFSVINVDFKELFFNNHTAWLGSVYSPICYTNRGR